MASPAAGGTGPRRNQRRAAHLGVDWVMLGIGFVAGLVVAGTLAAVFRRPPPAAPPPAVALPAVPPAAELQFYKLLRETEVTVPTGKMAPWQSRDRAERLLQVGAFRSWDEAEQLRGRLSLQRLEPFIDSVEIGGGTWHRVQIGPFDSLPLLHAAQSKLRALALASLVIVRSPREAEASEASADDDAGAAAP